MIIENYGSMWYYGITQSLWYGWAFQEVEGHFVQDFGARPQYGADREDFEEGGGDKVIIMDLLHFTYNGKWFYGGWVTGLSYFWVKWIYGSLNIFGCRREAFGQPRHSMWALWRWWRRIQTWWFLDSNNCVVDSWYVCVHIIEPLWEVESYFFLAFKQITLHVSILV